MDQSAFDGEYWNTDAETPHITRFRFERRDIGVFVSAWGACFPRDCEWGETEFHMLAEADTTAPATHGFATWRQAGDPTHCLMTSVDDSIEVVVVSIQSEIPSYRTTGTFRKNTAKSAEALVFDPISKLKRMWDGSEPGWTLIQHASEVFLVEFHFDESGPNESELQVVREFVDECRDETVERSRERLRGCHGIGIAKPIGREEMNRLNILRRERTLNLTIDSIGADDYLVLTPSGYHFNWIPLRTFRRPVVERMLAAGVEIVSG